jgi:type IV fimbrial biogenesis protein FimT
MLSAARRARGFTLVEVGVVLANLGLLLVAVLPEMSAWLRGLRVRGTAETLLAGLQKARVEALKRNREVAFWLVSSENMALTANCAASASSSSWVVSEHNPAGLCDQPPSLSAAPLIADKRASREDNGGVTVAALDAAGNAVAFVAFNGFGQVVTGAGGLRRIDVAHGLDNKVRALRVEVSAGGLVRLCDPNVPATDTRACS